ncbi:MAG: ferredoxin reductase family protein [Nocardioidaceae bacterium]
MTALRTDLPRTVPAVRLRRPGRRARFDGVVRTATGSALWLGLLLVTYWWVADGGVQGLGGRATGLISVGRLAGLVASVLLLAQVVLMARIPVLEAAFGQDRLAHLHRLVGFTSFQLMVLHIVTITWGYASGELGLVLTTLWDLVTGYSGILLATGGTACLVMVVVTSVKLARRRLRYESWHLLHLYAYLGVGLALPHQLWTGQQFLSSPAKTVFWWTSWALVAAAVLVWRVGLPLWRNLRHRLVVTSVVTEGSDVASVYVTGRRMDRLRVEAGQFLTWRFATGPGWSRAHPYSLSAAPDGRSLRITVQVVGDGSAGVLALRGGTRAFVEGPYGRLSARTRTRPKVALIGAGVGITPLRSLAEGLDYARGDAVLLQRYTSEPLFDRELGALHKARGLRVLNLPGRRRTPDSWLGDHVGTVDDLTALRFWVPDIAERDVYVCGPERWTELVRSTLLEAGVPSDLVHLETFAW